MFGCGLGKQEPYAHSGRHGREKPRQRKQASLGQREHSCQQGWTFSPLVAEGGPLEPRTAQPLLLLRRGIAWEFTSGDCGMEGRRIPDVPSNKREFPVSSSPFYYFPCGHCAVIVYLLKNVVLQCPSLSGHLDFSVKTK